MVWILINSPHWPLAELRVVAGPIELRSPTASDVARFGEEAAGEDYSPSMPIFSVRSDSPTDRARRTIQFCWQRWASWHPARWGLPLSVLHGDELVGLFNISGHDFSQVRQALTGSWIFHDQRGRGLATLARAAVLDFVFDGLGARHVLSEVDATNAASLRVTKKLGFEPDGATYALVEGEVLHQLRFRHTVESWRARPKPGVRAESHGLEACLPLFGLA